MMNDAVGDVDVSSTFTRRQPLDHDRSAPQRVNLQALLRLGQGIDPHALLVVAHALFGHAHVVVEGGDRRCLQLRGERVTGAAEQQECGQCHGGPPCR